MSKVKDQLGWTLFWLLVIAIALIAATFYPVIWLFLVAIILIFVFIDKYKEDRIATLWTTLTICFTVLLLLTLGLAFGDTLHFINGDWKKVNADTCEKVMVSNGLGSDACNTALTNLLNENANYLKDNLSASRVANPQTIPQCYREECK